MELRKSYDCMISTSRPSRLALFVVEKWPSLPRAAAVPRVYEISYIGGVHVKAGVMALCVTFGLLHKNSPRRFWIFTYSTTYPRLPRTYL